MKSKSKKTVLFCVSVLFLAQGGGTYNISLSQSVDFCNQFGENVVSALYADLVTAHEQVIVAKFEPR